jgi:hypothetical protein
MRGREYDFLGSEYKLLSHLTVATTHIAFLITSSAALLHYASHSRFG